MVLGVSDRAGEDDILLISMISLKATAFALGAIKLKGSAFPNVIALVCSRAGMAEVGIIGCTDAKLSTLASINCSREMSAVAPIAVPAVASIGMAGWFPELLPSEAE